MWQLRIQDPSGETRTIALRARNRSALKLGRAELSDIQLRDPTANEIAAQIWTKTEDKESIYWIRTEQGSAGIRLGDLLVKEAQLPPKLPVRIGETTLVLESDEEQVTLPEFPTGVRPWLTASEGGRTVLWTTKKAAATPLSIYIGGETGTGKEVIAQLIHSWSDRAAGPFVPLHCGALPISLIESELFGHVKGAFTGATHHRPGALMQAHNGTLFLDEIGDLPMDIQVKLLRFLENGEIRQVGADRISRADVRLVCATHKPLEKLVEEGKFRRDLYYRLASVTIHIPPLKCRPEDVTLLTHRFAGEFGKSVSRRALLRLQAHSWPGNVRELRHAIERACGLAGPFCPVLNEDAFEFLLTPTHITATPALELGAAVLTLNEMERVMLLKALKLSNGNRAFAARILGVARSTLFEMLKRHKITGPRTKFASLNSAPRTKFASLN